MQVSSSNLTSFHHSHHGESEKKSQLRMMYVSPHSPKNLPSISTMWRKLVQLFFLCICQIFIYVLSSYAIDKLFQTLNPLITSQWKLIVITFFEIYIIYVTFYVIRNVTEYLFLEIMFRISTFSNPNKEQGGPQRDDQFDWTRKPKEITGTVICFYVFMQLQTQFHSNVKVILKDMFG